MTHAKLLDLLKTHRYAEIHELDGYKYAITAHVNACSRSGKAEPDVRVWYKGPQHVPFSPYGNDFSNLDPSILLVFARVNAAAHGWAKDGDSNWPWSTEGQWSSVLGIH